MESPTFSEASLRRPTEARTRIAREVFDRKKTLSECPAHLTPVFEDLFKRIDTIELMLNYYEFSHGRRKEPPRAALLKRFTQEDLLYIGCRLLVAHEAAIAHHLVLVIRGIGFQRQVARYGLPRVVVLAMGTR